MFEDKGQKYAGVFSGILKTKWYLDKNNNLKYDNININSDGYFNNAFVGTWKIYDNGLPKKCNWGDYRVPNSNCDFDTGTGEFNVSEKYIKNGWVDIRLKNMAPNPAVIKSKGAAQKKDWWM